ncbi:hypothetical protein BV898_09776 [Hypsibius exemplaris]|uniref:Peptidase S1 domain-containing protein n=1 Tax=Hypsibius exemplaris TaxID=2072580 RepID=A0A1W0WLP8_HYPEX|nr:hypothetical protein BV898_09776 [Hypsibius exemplaris]
MFCPLLTVNKREFPSHHKGLPHKDKLYRSQISKTSTANRQDGHELLKRALTVALTIVGGSVFLENQLYWTATVYFDVGMETYIFGGVIIGPHMVLSTAQCYVDEGIHASPSNISEVVGLPSSDTNHITETSCADVCDVKRNGLHS